MPTASKARLRLPPVPDRDSGTAWEDLRRELRHHNIVLTVLGLTPEGRPSIKLVGTKESLRAWLDQAGYDMVEVE
jgi:hypothetical protein